MPRVAATESPAAMEGWRLAYGWVVAADRRAMLYRRGTANNATGRWIELLDAVRTGRPYLVRVHPAMLAVDADQRDAMTTVRVLADRLTAAGLRPVICASGQPGRAHLFCRVGDAATRAHATEAARTLGLDVRETIRPPLAPHRLAGCSYPLTPADWRIALAALATVPPRPRGPLSARLRRLLTHGER